jgi:YVTN family beta-propeller protein
MPISPIRRGSFLPLVLAASAASVWSQPSLYVTNQNSSSVSVVDTRTNAVTGSLISAFSPSSGVLSPDGARLFTVTPNSNIVMVYNTATNGLLTTINIGQTPSAVAVDAQRIYVTLHSNAALAVFNTASFTQTASIRVGFGPNAVAVSSANGRVYVANTYSSTVSVIDPTRIGTVNNPVIGTIIVPDSPVALSVSADGQSAWVVSSAKPTISRIDLATNEVAGSIALPVSPAGLALSGDGNRAYVPGYGPKVATVDLRAGAVLNTIALPECDGPRCVAMGAAVSADGKTVYVANTSANQVAVLDADKGTVISNVRVQLGPRGLILGAAPRTTTTAIGQTEATN